MSRKRCHRKQWALVNPILHALTGAAITDTARLDKLRLIELSALDSFRAGTPTINDWKAMADVVNIAETMATSGVGHEVLPACRKAEEALGTGYRRFKAHGHIGRGPGEYEALAELCEYHDLQRSSISRGEYERAIEKTANRIRGASPHVKVLIQTN